MMISCARKNKHNMKNKEYGVYLSTKDKRWDKIATQRDL